MIRNALSWPLVAAVVFLAGISFSAEAKSPPKHDAPKSAEENGKTAEKGKVFDNWGVVCETQSDGKTKKCFAQQVQTTKEGGQHVLTIAIGYLGPKGEPMLVAVLPLGINLQTGAAIKIDEQAQIPLKLQQCTPAGCQAVTPLTEEQLKSLTGGKSMGVGVMPWGKTETMSMAAPLKGLAEALAASK